MTNFIAELTSPEQALELTQGRLVMDVFEVSFSPENVLTAAALLIEKEDNANLVSQAGVIARAGKHGWGMGDVYRTV
jgi:hypothetical protein